MIQREVKGGKKTQIVGFYWIFLLFNDSIRQARISVGQRPIALSKQCGANTVWTFFLFDTVVTLRSSTCSFCFWCAHLMLRAQREIKRLWPQLFLAANPRFCHIWLDTIKWGNPPHHLPTVWGALTASFVKIIKEICSLQPLNAECTFFYNLTK